jgi:hypothetical protein
VRIAWKALGLLLLLTAVLYAFDYVSAKYAIPSHRQVYADVTIDQYWAIREKGNKIEYSPADAAVERCVYAIFPHFGYKPCWYVMRHTRRAIEVGRTQSRGKAASARFALATGENGRVVDVLGRGAAGKVVYRSGESLQHRPDGDCAAQPFCDLVPDVAG